MKILRKASKGSASLLLFLALCFPSLAAPAADQEERKLLTSLQGLVIDSRTRQPVAEARVSLERGRVPADLRARSQEPLVSAIYLFWGALLFDFPLRGANWLAVGGVLLASILAFSGLGILSAGHLLLFKRGNPAKWFILGVSSLTGGMLFPVSILPDWLQFLARINPVTYALDALRQALLSGAGIFQILRPLAALLLFAAILLPLSMAAFAWALRRTKLTGTLTHI